MMGEPAFLYKSGLEIYGGKLQILFKNDYKYAVSPDFLSSLFLFLLFFFASSYFAASPFPTYNPSLYAHLSTQEFRLFTLLLFFLNMSTNHFRIKRADQENAHQSQVIKSDSKVSKRPALQQKNIKRQRVPLGGKDNNGNVPSLSRSNTLVEKSTSHHNNPSFLTRKPSLAKSNSSLGFFHAPREIDANTFTQPPPPPRQQNPTSRNPLQNNRLPASLAQRQQSLVPQHVSDSIVKKDTPRLAPLHGSLKDTFTTKTQQLHASNLNPKSVLYHNVDPAKDGIDHDTIEQLAQDPLSMGEGIPDEEPQALPDTPSDGLSQEDLQFIKTGRSRSTHDEENALLQRELEKEHGALGVTAEELEMLLD